MANHLLTPWHVDPLSATVYASDVPKGPARVADMRGWGYLTGKGQGALALSQDEAIDIQRANAAFIVKAVNNHARLEADLAEAVRLLDALLGLEKGSGAAALAFVERHNGAVGGSGK